MRIDRKRGQYKVHVYDLFAEILQGMHTFFCVIPVIFVYLPSQPIFGFSFCITFLLSVKMYCLLYKPLRTSSNLWSTVFFMLVQLPRLNAFSL